MVRYNLEKIIAAVVEPYKKRNQWSPNLIHLAESGVVG